MEQETYYRYAEVAVQRVTYILQLILLHQASYVSLCASITRWSGIASMEGAVIIAREKVARIMAAVNWLFILVRWTKAHGEVALLYAEDLAIFIRRRHRFTPCRSRRIDDVLHQDCYTWFKSAFWFICTISRREHHLLRWRDSYLGVILAASQR